MAKNLKVCCGGAVVTLVLLLACGSPHIEEPTDCRAGQERSAMGECVTPTGEKKPSIVEFFSQPDLRIAGAKFVNQHPSPGFCYVEGSLAFAVTTFSQAQTDALAKSSAMPVGPGWFLVMNTADGATWRSSCSSSWGISGSKALDIRAPGYCDALAGGDKPSSQGAAYLSLGYRDAEGVLISDCGAGGSIVLTQSGADVTVTLYVQMSDGSAITDKQFVVRDLF